jgi:hypothetical protein
LKLWLVRASRLPETTGRARIVAESSRAGARLLFSPAAAAIGVPDIGFCE